MMTSQRVPYDVIIETVMSKEALLNFKFDVILILFCISFIVSILNSRLLRCKTQKMVEAGVTYLGFGRCYLINQSITLPIHHIAEGLTIVSGPYGKIPKLIIHGTCLFSTEKL